MENLTVILQIVLPAAMVGGIAYFIVYKFLQYEENKLKLEIDKARLEIVFPARMQRNAASNPTRASSAPWTGRGLLWHE